MLSHLPQQTPSSMRVECVPQGTKLVRHIQLQHHREVAVDEQVTGVCLEVRGKEAEDRTPFSSVEELN